MSGETNEHEAALVSRVAELEDQLETAKLIIKSLLASLKEAGTLMARHSAESNICIDKMLKNVEEQTERAVGSLA